MSQLFISHSTKDKSIAVGILNHLRKIGFPDDLLFLDSDEQSGILPGLRWKEQLFSSLENCACLIVVNTENWRGSKWCFAEALIATNLGQKIIPLLVETPPELNTIISEYQSIRDFSLSDAKLEELETTLIRLKLLPSGYSEGWKITSADAEVKERIANKVLSRMPWWWNLSLLTTFLTFALVAFLSIGSTAYVFREPLYAWMFPAEVVELSVDDFLHSVHTASEREKIQGKKVAELTGQPVADYSASKPRIKIDKIVEINIRNMAGGDPIPESLPNPVTFRCVVESVSPTTIGDEVIKIIVYVSEFESLE